MKILKINSLLAMLLLSFFMFTACDDSGTDPDDPTGGTPLPAAISNLQGAGISGTEIKVTWTASTSVDSIWFKDYIVTVVDVEDADTVVNGYSLPKSSTSFTFNEAVEGTRYDISIVGRNTGDSINANNIKTFRWAAAAPFIKDDTGSDIKLYGSSSQYGSGLALYDASTLAPAVYKVANLEKWNIGFTTSGSVAKIGSAKATGYTNATTKVVTDGLISPLQDWDGDNLTSGPMFNMGSNLDNGVTFSSTLIDLKNDPKATAATRGVCFFVKAGNNYAKVVVLKKNGKFVQNETTSDAYIQCYVSYQTSSGTPYAKIFAGK